MKNKTFTLIELLVVVAIIGILVSILMPSLHNARTKAVNAVCMSNLKQTASALTIYSMKNSGYVTESSNYSVHPMDIQNNQTGVRADVREVLKGYLSDFSIWKCSFLDAAADIDDPSVTSTSYTRSTYMYWANLDGIGGKILDNNMGLWSPRNALMSDCAYTWNGNWRAGHDKGNGTFYQFWDYMPSLKVYINGTLRDINQSYADGSVKNTKSTKIVYKWGGSDCRVASDTQLD